jgi:DNA phosphorothioation-dependent restriction protein DptG
LVRAAAKLRAGRQHEQTQPRETFIDSEASKGIQMHHFFKCARRREAGQVLKMSENVSLLADANAIANERIGRP